ncbi:MAG TPA: hypothetical protein VL048_03790 [Xanthobacteraceae bacterium]|nr:hypothetical protein [Xanthobacteraceae bacterium]
MAKQVEQAPAAGRINRTPAPDEISHVRSPSGATYGQNDGTANPSRTPAPGVRVVSGLGLNMEQSVDDPALAEVIAHGVAGRGDQVPAPKSEDWQERAEPAEPFPITFGHKRVSPPTDILK